MIWESFRDWWIARQVDEQTFAELRLVRMQEAFTNEFVDWAVQVAETTARYELRIAELKAEIEVLKTKALHDS